MSNLASSKHGILIDDLERVLTRTRSSWEELRGQRIFVTGGTGFFGKWLLETFLHANKTLQLESELLVLTRDPQRFTANMPHLIPQAGLQYHAGDVRSFDFPAGAFSHIIHAATEASAQLNEHSPHTMFDVIATGTRRVLDFADSCGARKLLLISSGAVYGKQPAGMTHLPEDYSGGPDVLSSAAAYGEGKRVAEMLCALAHRHRNLDVQIARCFAFVGPYLPLDSHFAVGNFLQDALRGQPIAVRGTGRVYRSYLYAADLAAWLWTILFRGRSCRPYNVGSDRALSILDIAHAAAKLPMHPLAVQISDPSNAAAPSYYVPSIERARRELGLEIETEFPAALARTFRWHQKRSNNPDTFVKV